MQPLLVHLQQLASLNLSGCVIEDSLQCFGGLAQLSSLNMNTANFERVEHHTLSGVINHYEFAHLWALTNLRRLALPNVALHPKHLADLGTLRTLQELNIAGCDSVNLSNSQACAELFAGLTNLTALQMSMHERRFSESDAFS